MDVSSLKETCLYGLAAFGATLFVQVLHPLDVLKTRFQSVIFLNKTDKKF